MGNSYRLRTKVGVDKALNVALEQDFESLEILSLKILQSQIYTRQCSDYGVVVGRVTANNGLGIPNVKVSIFIPLSDKDSENPTISDIYPYKTLNDLNEDGYRYNLLPYEQSHGGHTPTGTFPSRQDVLTIPEVSEVYDKYYKFTSKTNDSGDFMLFGVPLGTQTVHIDVDLSDIGEFSLSPQDMIRLNLANEQQVAGTEFRASTNLGDLPQIKQANRTIEVVPLWGQPEICYLGITRLDFDLSQEFGIKIEPAAVFMGSIISNVDKEAVKRNCKVRKKIGNLCNMIAGPGEILSIRQTIGVDEDGRPVLEEYPLESGGKCIDENGTWLLDLPMNLDYVYTDEFGNRQISNDPNIGIPTKAKYRFKIKWEQAPSLANEVIRAAFLVPNIKEWGWANYSDDPAIQDPNFLDATFGGCPKPDDTFINTPQVRQVAASYAFSLNWADYGEKDSAGNLTSLGLQMVDEAITCQDRFFEMIHSKVYTISQLISEHRGGLNRYKIIAVKDILDETCEGTHNKFPANDGIFQSDIIYILFTFILGIFQPILFAVMLLKHIVTLIVCILFAIVSVIAAVFCAIRDVFCQIADLEILGVSPFGFFQPVCDLFQGICGGMQDTADSLGDKCKNSSMNLPMMTYPDCEMCDCETPSQTGEDASSSTGSAGANLINAANQAGATAFISPQFQPQNWQVCIDATAPDIPQTIGMLPGGRPLGTTIGEAGRAPYLQAYDDPALPNGFEYVTAPCLPYFERVNLFNTKAKYFDESGANPGGGWNRIRASFAFDLPGNGYSKYHMDNVVVLITKPSISWAVGQMISFNDIIYSQDPNLTALTQDNQFGNRAITGTTRGTDLSSYYQIDNYPVEWAVTNGLGVNTTYYNFTARTDNQFANFPMDIEYFQVIHNTTVGDYIAKATTVDGGQPSTLLNRVFQGGMTAFEITYDTTDPSWNPGGSIHFSTGHYGASGFLDYTCFKDYGQQKLIFLVRGVDPYSTRQKCRFDISRLYGANTDFNTGWSTDPDFIVEDDFKLNIPIRGNFKCTKHEGNNNSVDSYAGQYLYNPSYEFIPDTSLMVSFASSAITTYSRIDSTQQSFGGTPNTIYSFGVNSGGPNGSLRIDSTNWLTRSFYNVISWTNPINLQTRNYFSYIPNNVTTSDLADPNITNNTMSNGRNQGYFINENVEGGSYMYGDFSGLQPVFDETALGSGIFYMSYPPVYTSNIDFVGAYLCEPFGSNFNYVPSERIIMRSDRLPMSSTQLFPGGSSSPIPGLAEGISYPLMGNNLLSVYTISDNGDVSASSTPPSTGDAGAGQDNQADLESNPVIGNIAESLGCGGLAPFRCYTFDEDGFLTLDADTTHECWLNQVNIGDISISTPNPDTIVENGCYKLVTAPIITIPLDFYLIFEWTARIKMNFAACRNVLGHMFTNQWINGTLFMYPIRNQVRYTAPSDFPSNAPYICACQQLVFPDYNTNVLYYRSSPYDGTNFIGKTNAVGFGPFNIDFEDSSGANVKILQNPTTILDLGPRTKYTSELVLDARYEGYIMNRLYHTSFKDVSELLSQFFLTRLLSRSIAGLILDQFVTMLGGGAAGVSTDLIRRLFNDRGFRKVDGDYAQMLAINSQIGIKEFDPDEYYLPEPNSVPIVPVSSVYSSPGTAKFNVFGVFYKEEIQLRDWLSPHRLVVSPTGPIVNPCTFSNIPIFTQTIPIYQWQVKQNTGGLLNPAEDSIFGNQDNDWKTDPSTFFITPYQGMDRLNSDFMHPENTTLYTYNKAYIFNVNPAGEINPQPPQPPGNPDRIYTSSGPYYFYFGLSLGKTAYDRFLVKWIKTDNYEF